MGPATEREESAYSTLRRRLDTVQADVGAMPARLIRSRLALTLQLYHVGYEWCEDTQGVQYPKTVH